MSLYDRARRLWLEAIALLREAHAYREEAAREVVRAEASLPEPALPPYRLRPGESYYADAATLIDHCGLDRGMQALLECKGDPHKREA